MPDQERLSEQQIQAIREKLATHPASSWPVLKDFDSLAAIIDSLARQLTEAEQRAERLEEGVAKFGETHRRVVASFHKELAEWDARWDQAADRIDELEGKLAEAERENGRLREVARYWLIGEYLASGRGQLSDEEADQAIDAALEDSGSGEEPSAEYVKQMGEVEDVSWATKLSRKMLPGGSGEESG